MPVATAAGPALVHFFDFAQLNSVRTLPYVVEWARRYGPDGLEDDRRAGAALPLRRRTRARSQRAWSGSGSNSRSRSTPIAPLARLRLRGLAQPLPLEAGRRADLVPLRRGRIPGHRGSDPGRAARAGCPARAARADGAAAPDRRPGRQGDAPHPGALPRRLVGAALDRGRGRRGAWRSTTRPAAPTPPSRERARSPSRSTAQPTDRSRSTAPRLYTLAEHATPRVAPPRAPPLPRLARLVRQLRRGRALSAGAGYFANLLRQHEAHVLVDGAQLGDVLGAALAEELDQALDQLLGGAGAGGDADRLDALQPLLLAPGCGCRSGARRRRVRARPRPGGWSWRSWSSRSRAPARTRGRAA